MGMTTMHVDLKDFGDSQDACEQSHQEGARPKAVATLHISEHACSASCSVAGISELADSLQEIELPEGNKGQRPADEHPGHHDEHCPA